MKSIQKIKDSIAREKGYPNWKEMYDWICREGQRPDVVAQLIEAAMEEVMDPAASSIQGEEVGKWIEITASTFPDDCVEVLVCFKYQPEVILAYFAHESGKWIGSSATRDYMGDGFVRDPQLVDTPEYYMLLPERPKIIEP